MRNDYTCLKFFYLHKYSKTSKVIGTTGEVVSTAAVAMVIISGETTCRPRPSKG